MILKLIRRLRGKSKTRYYTHPSKGGCYEFVGEATGAGRSHGKQYVTYRNVKTGAVYVRERNDFRATMVRVGSYQ